MIENAQKLVEDEAMAYFRADVCLGSPQSFTLDEKREICQQMESTSKAIEDAMKADFDSLRLECRDLLVALCDDLLPVGAVYLRMLLRRLLLPEVFLGLRLFLRL